MPLSAIRQNSHWDTFVERVFKELAIRTACRADGFDFHENVGARRVYGQTIVDAPPG
jgi:hypothetical protein